MTAIVLALHRSRPWPVLLAKIPLVLSLTSSRALRPAVSGSGATTSARVYLSRVDAALLDSDRQLLAYALMPDRIDWLAVAGETPLSRFIKPLHVGFALWLNRNQRHAGPVFAERPRTLESELADTLDLITYIHNTPVREGHAAEASESRWTSHRAYLGLDPTPAWLHAERGMKLCEMSPDADGRQRFTEYVASRLGRADLMVRPSGAVRTALIERAIHAPRRWDGPIAEVLDGVNSVSGIEPARIRSSDRSREVVGARRVAILAGTRYLGRTLTEMAPGGRHLDLVGQPARAHRPGQADPGGRRGGAGGGHADRPRQRRRCTDRQRGSGSDPRPGRPPALTRASSPAALFGYRFRWFRLSSALSVSESSVLWRLPPPLPPVPLPPEAARIAWTRCATSR